MLLRGVCMDQAEASGLVSRCSRDRNDSIEQFQNRFRLEVSLGFWFRVSLTRFRGLEPQASREGGSFHVVRVCLDGYLDRTVTQLPASRTTQMVQARRLDGSLWTVMV